MNGSVIYLLLLLFFYTLSSKIIHAYQILFDDDRLVGWCYAACIQEGSRKLNDSLVEISLDLHGSFCMLYYVYSISEEPVTVNAIIIIFLTPHPLCFMHPVVCKSWIARVVFFFVSKSRLHKSIFVRKTTIIIYHNRTIWASVSYSR